LHDLIVESSNFPQWDEPEWGFPKGRRNSHEKDYDCALREFQEETGLNKNVLHNLQNVLPFEEIFTGSNYKSYKHKYYIMFVEDFPSEKENGFQKSEVSKMEWKTFPQSLECIRDYNVEKKQLITRLHNSLTKYKVIF
jgi:8-oxo-dGTP pyrophosphatase MutT (NUDIX family)